jgi:hypothetical protein
MGGLSIDPLGDSLAAEPDGDLSARLQLWMRRLGDLAEEVRDDPELAAALARQIRSAEAQLATLARERDRSPYSSSFKHGLSINPWG